MFYSEFILLDSINNKFQIFPEILILLQFVIVSHGLSGSEDLVIPLLKTPQCLPFACRPQARLSTLAYKALCVWRPLSSDAPLPLLILSQHTGEDFQFVEGSHACLPQELCMCHSLCLECCYLYILCSLLLLIS